MLIATALSHHWVYNLQSNTPSHFTRLPRAVWTYASSCDMSQDSISTQDFIREIDESIIAHDKLLEFSKQDNLILPENMNPQQQFAQGITIPNPAFEQAVNTPLPPSPSEQQPSASTSSTWNSQQIMIIYNHRDFYQRMIMTLDTMQKNGPTGTLPKMPKRPKTGLREIYGKRAKKVETPAELHQYLIDNFADVSSTITREVFVLQDTTSYEEMILQLNRGVRNIRRQEAQTLLFYITFGHFLEKCKRWFEDQKKQQLIEGTWAKWLEQQSGYSDIHARKLRQISGPLFGYPMFFKVGLPFRTIYSKKEQIKRMLDIEEYRQYWIQPFDPPKTVDQRQSQPIE